MPYSATTVLPLPVGAATTTWWPASRASIASTWKWSRGKGYAPTISARWSPSACTPSVSQAAASLRRFRRWKNSPMKYDTKYRKIIGTASANSEIGSPDGVITAATTKMTMSA